MTFKGGDVEVKEIIKHVVSSLLTGFAMFCVWDLEKIALAEGINGTQFMYAIAGVSLLGGVTLAPVIEIVKRMGGSKPDES